MYMKKIWKKCFRQKNQLFLLLLLLTIIQCKQRYIRTSLPCNVTISYIYFKIIDPLSATFKDRQISK
jgi:hypothetical protein